MKGDHRAHGGTVEKFIGDAVMAVFGVPAVHEDDALRAVPRRGRRCATRFPELGASQARIGINTGEVVAGTAARLVAGDAVNVAARLEQAAPPGEMLLGSDTYDLVCDSVRAEPVEPLSLKGKSEAVQAHRLVDVVDAPDAPRAARARRAARRVATPARRLRARRLRPAVHAFTVVGEAGVGKSRLAAELEARRRAGAVVRGRCLPYGEGITYWPVVEVAASELERRLTALEELLSTRSAVA